MHACLWCKISANERYVYVYYTYTENNLNHATKRWDMSVDEKVYCQEKSRSLIEIWQPKLKKDIAANIWAAFTPRCSTLSWITSLWMSFTWCCVWGMCCSETWSCTLTAETMLAENIKGKTPTTCSSWNKLFAPVGWVSRYGRGVSQQGNPYLEAMSGQPSQASTSWKCWRCCWKKWALWCWTASLPE